MKKRNVFLEVIIVYALLLAMTSLPLLLYKVITDGFVVRVITYLLMFGVVVFVCKKNKVTLKELGYSSKNIFRQIIAGGVPLLCTLSIFVILPLVLGVNKEYVLSSGSTNCIYIVEQIVFLMIFVGPVEEFIFRGYFENAIKQVITKPMIVSIVSSLIFGFWHFPSTMSLINVTCTFVIGLIFSIAKSKLKNCSMLSLSIGHGLHDTIIFLVACFLSV